MKEWITLATARFWMQRIFEIFDHERFMIAHRRKMFPVFLRIRTKFRRRILRFGKNSYEVRQRKYIRDSITTGFGNMLRGTIRERAKQEVMDFCTIHYEKAVLMAKF